MPSDNAQLKHLVESLPFVKSHFIEIVEVGHGKCLARMPMHEAFSTPPRLFPAAMVGMLGDVAGITACISALQPGLICSTMDFTVKMIETANGDLLEAEGESLNAGKTIANGQSKVYCVVGNERKLCAMVMVTGRVIGSKRES